MNMDDQVHVHMNTPYYEHWARLDEQVHPITQIPVWEYLGALTERVLRDQIHEHVYHEWALKHVPDPH